MTIDEDKIGEMEDKIFEKIIRNESIASLKGKSSECRKFLEKNGLEPCTDHWRGPWSSFDGALVGLLIGTADGYQASICRSGTETTH